MAVRIAGGSSLSKLIELDTSGSITKSFGALKYVVAIVPDVGVCRYKAAGQFAPPEAAKVPYRQGEQLPAKLRAGNTDAGLTTGIRV